MISLLAFRRWTKSLHRHFHWYTGCGEDIKYLLSIAYFFLFSCSFESLDPLSSCCEDDVSFLMRVAPEFMLLFKAVRAVLSIGVYIRKYETQFKSELKCKVLIVLWNDETCLFCSMSPSLSLHFSLWTWRRWNHVSK